MPTRMHLLPAVISSAAALLAAGCDGAGTAGARSAPAPAPTPVHSAGPSDETAGFLLTPDDVGLYWRSAGSGPAVILPGRLFVWDDFHWLADEGFTVIAYDMRNRGRSEAVADGGRLTLEADVRDLEAVRSHFGVETFTPIGYSYLGMMVALYAVEHPERVERIVQIGPVPPRFGTEYPPELRAERPPDPEVVARLRGLRAGELHVTRPREYCAEEWTSYTRPRLVGDPANVEAAPPADFVCSMPNEWPLHLARHFDHHFGSVQNFEPPLERLRALPHPVLTIHGRLDLNAPYGAGREWASLVPDGRLLTVERGAHQCFAEYPEVVRPAIRAFLTGSWPEDAQRVDPSAR